MALHYRHTANSGRTLTVFCCDHCGELIHHVDSLTTGYGVHDDGTMHCFQCCAWHDLQDMKRTGRATLYLSGPKEDGSYRVTNWPGTLSFHVHAGGVRRGRHNIAGARWDAWFRGPEGHTWHGVMLGHHTQIIRCKRTKER
jgi:hypothetical protein